MDRTLLVIFSLVFFSCQAQEQTTPTESNDYIRTVMPFHIDNLTDEHQKIISDRNDTDTSGYLIDTRPIVFQIVETINDQDQTRYTQKINRDVAIEVYALGEEKDGELVDYGWIENTNGDIIWKMTMENSSYAGGDARNRKANEFMTLPAGTYLLRYISNESHAYGDWHHGPPENKSNYGITIFNTKAIEAINPLIN